MNKIKLLHNKGVLAINVPDKLPEKKSVIVLGAPRGGTSMVAGTLQHLDVPMGDNLSAVYEDIALSEAVEQDQSADVVSIIDRNNATHSVWGWKRPSAINHITSWQGRFRNPFYIVVFRDLFAIANRNRISMLSDVVSNMCDISRHFELILNFVTRIKDPILFVSYEKVMTNPEYFVKNLSRFIGVWDERCIKAAVNFIEPNPEVYLNMSRITKSKGVIDIVRRDRVSGWAMYLQESQRQTKVLIKINEKREFVVVADHFRQDLFDKGIHPTGKCGFVLTLAEGDLLHPDDSVSACVVGDINCLKNSPTMVTL